MFERYARDANRFCRPRGASPAVSRIAGQPSSHCASAFCAVAGAAAECVLVTNDTDYISAPPAALFAVWTAVNRISRSNVVIGPDQRVTPLEALRAMTTSAAFQYFEENSKGTLEVGKLADLVILDNNPLTVDSMTIKDIKVVGDEQRGQYGLSARLSGQDHLILGCISPVPSDDVIAVGTSALELPRLSAERR